MNPLCVGISIRDSREISAKTLRVTELLDATVPDIILGAKKIMTTLMVYRS